MIIPIYGLALVSHREIEDDVILKIDASRERLFVNGCMCSDKAGRKASCTKKANFDPSARR